MNDKLKSTLRWIFLLPGAVFICMAGTFLVTVLLAIFFRGWCTTIDPVSGYEVRCGLWGRIEFFLTFTPIIRSALFVVGATYIAPNYHKLVLVCSALVYLAALFYTILTSDTNFGTWPIIGELLGVIVGALIMWKVITDDTNPL